MEHIEARVIDVDSHLDVLRIERDENEIRKAFTVSERVAIGKAIEEALGNRRGQRTDLGVCAENAQGGLRQNFAEVANGKRTDQIAAEKAGFGNKETYRQAKTVTEQGAQELVEAMDTGRASVSAAAEIASLPKEEQAEIVACIIPCTARTPACRYPIALQRSPALQQHNGPDGGDLSACSVRSRRMSPSGVLLLLQSLQLLHMKAPPPPAPESTAGRPCPCGTSPALRQWRPCRPPRCSPARRGFFAPRPGGVPGVLLSHHPLA